MKEVCYTACMETDIEKNLTALAEKSYSSGIARCTDFLSASEMTVYETCKTRLSYASPRAYGGYEGAERQVVRFGEGKFPVVCLKIEPINAKFSDKLTHRDFLGSVLNLGLDRSVIGDIIVKDNTGDLFCLERMEPFILQNLTRVAHTSVVASKYEGEVSEVCETEQMTCTVSSLRADCLACAVFHVSRGDAEKAAENGFLLVNGRQIKPSFVCKEGYVLTLRGKGKFCFLEERGMTKKERHTILALKYR